MKLRWSEALVIVGMAAFASSFALAEEPNSPCSCAAMGSCTGFTPGGCHTCSCCGPIGGTLTCTCCTLTYDCQNPPTGQRCNDVY